jgi:exopolysaccharide biosynthesis protein
MTLYELARFMKEIGCRDGINLDGGGSTAMVVGGRLVNLPADGVERPVQNALLVF